MVREFLECDCGLKITDIQKLEKTDRNAILLKALQFGAGLRQLSRMTGVSRGLIKRIIDKADDTKGDGSVWYHFDAVEK